MKITHLRKQEREKFGGRVMGRRIEGYFVLRDEDGKNVPARTWWELPLDPLTGEPLDRSPKFRAVVGGVEADEDQIEIILESGVQITSADYRQLLLEGIDHAAL